MTVMVHTTQPDPAAVARRPDPAGPLAVATPTTRKLADASISVNTRRAYLGALRRLDAWRGAAPVDDASLAVYLGELFEAGRAPATAALAVAAVRFRAKLAGQPDPARANGRRPGPGPGRPAARGRARRDSRHRRPAPHGRPGRRIPHHGAPPGPTRRRERPPACWAATVARPPTGAGARPPRCARTGSPRFSPPLAGNWKTARMVAHYSAGATAERGAVARYL